MSVRADHTTASSRVLTPRMLFQGFATAEMFTWMGLITALILRALEVVNVVPIAGGVHGFVFLCYCVTTVFVWVNQRWHPGIGLTGLVLAIVPFATVPFERIIDRKGLLGVHWRLASGGDRPRGAIEHIQAWVLRHVVAACVLLVLLVTALFLTLLWLGPPVPVRD